jgi:hypothetical protein
MPKQTVKKRRKVVPIPPWVAILGIVSSCRLCVSSEESLTDKDPPQICQETCGGKAYFCELEPVQCPRSLNGSVEYYFN